MESQSEISRRQTRSMSRRISLDYRPVHWHKERESSSDEQDTDSDELRESDEEDETNTEVATQTDSGENEQTYALFSSDEEADSNTCTDIRTLGNKVTARVSDPKDKDEPHSRPIQLSKLEALAIVLFVFALGFSSGVYAANRDSFGLMSACSKNSVQCLATDFEAENNYFGRSGPDRHNVVEESLSNYETSHVGAGSDPDPEDSWNDLKTEEDTTDINYEDSVIEVDVYPRLDEAYTDEDELSSFMNTSAEESLRQFLNNLKEKFPHQSQDTWTELISSLSQSLKEEEPIQPSALTVLIPPKHVLNKKFAECFLDLVGHTFEVAHAKNVSHVPTRLKISSKQVLGSKIGELETRFKTHFQNHGKVLITLDLDQVDSEQHLLFYHGVADTTSPMDMRSILFFPVQVPPEVFQKYEWTRKNSQAIAHATLTEAWKGTLKRDNIAALITRVADGVILLNAGDECATQKTTMTKSFVTKSTGKTYSVTYKVQNKFIV